MQLPSTGNPRSAIIWAALPWNFRLAPPIRGRAAEPGMPRIMQSSVTLGLEVAGRSKAHLVL